jgi:hypothetical protein
VPLWEVFVTSWDSGGPSLHDVTPMTPSPIMGHKRAIMGTFVTIMGVGFLHHGGWEAKVSIMGFGSMNSTSWDPGKPIHHHGTRDPGHHNGIRVLLSSIMSDEISQIP